MIIKTPSRLHVTLIDLNGSQGRVDGGVGLTLQNPCLVLKLKPVDNGVGVKFSTNQLSLNRRKDYQSRIESSSFKMMEFLELEGGFDFDIQKTYPPHAGLGSGTQLSLAVGKLISNYAGFDLSAEQIAQIVGRGGTSGIGVVAFQEGGFVVDGGHRKSEKLEFLPSSASPASPPPVIARYNFPEDWKVLIIVPHFEDRVSGKKEVNIFQEYCPIALKEVEKLSHLLLMKMMPAVVECDLDAFGESLNAIQNLGFKKIENQLQNPIIGNLMESLRSAGAAGAGMSSFGPTVYAITDNNHKELVKAAEDVLGNYEAEIILTQAQNHGAELSTD
ncbi:MAG TPA: beta-ribofuranosylaminobenzene 5'-phosphate synthase [Methanobacteriaceae archaeon]|nr:beta-ribofuranosylaminobenzene 5'-phosphate synthase [Methanobacteriaceae archaeon]